MTAVTIAVCTFRRPHLAQTLASIGKLTPPQDVALDVLVVDNDEDATAHDLVKNARLPFPLRYLHAPGANISLARNAALSACSNRYLCFVDDDELVTPGWLNALWQAHLQTGAEIILGPVTAILADADANWIRRGGFYDTRPAYVADRIVTGYCCNVLIDLAAPAIAGRRFRLDLGRSGGEDTEFFYAATRAGAKIDYAPTATIEETMPENRRSLRWLQQRRYRSGQTHALLLREYERSSPAKEIFKAFLKAVACGLGCTVTLWSPIRWRRWYLRGALHVGVIAGLLGQAPVAIYAPENAKP